MTLPVAHFGEEGAYAAEAAGRMYPEAELVACHSIPDVVRAVTRGDAGCGVLPIENSLAGVVPETYDVLAHAPLSIIDETVLAVPHVLVGLPGTNIDALARIHSHPMALTQCRRFLSSLPDTLPEDASPVVRKLWATYRELTRKNVLEAYHDATEYKEECLTLFSLGHLTLADRVAAENLFWAVCQKVLRTARELDEMPEELETLERQLADTYFCNFSVFQSLPDSWAIDQLFPIMPVHRLTERPSRRGVLADITCDSDGKIEHFIDRRDVKDVLELHPINQDDYFIGIFLVGAYQEILGDLHNLFGDTNAVQVSLGPNGGYLIDHVVSGDTVTEVLNYVSYSKDDLVARVRRFAEEALRKGTMTLDQSRQLLRAYEDGLSGYTYLEREVDAPAAAMSGQQLRLVEKVEPGRSSTGT